MKTKVIRKALAICVLTLSYFVVSDGRPNGTALAAGSCYVEVASFGHYYGGGYAGSRFGSNTFWASNNVDCAANWGQSFAQNVGSLTCDQYNLNGGVGYVLLSWDWYYLGSPQDNGHLDQQYDCDDI